MRDGRLVDDGGGYGWVGVLRVVWRLEDVGGHGGYDYISRGEGAVGGGEVMATVLPSIKHISQQEIGI